MGSSQPPDHRQQLFYLEGLGDVVVHARFQAALPVAFHGMGGHRDDGDVAARLLLTRAQETGGLETVHLGHLNVHEDEVEGHPSGFGPLPGGHGLLAVAGDGDRVPLLLQDAHGQPLVDGVVLGQQEAEAWGSYPAAQARHPALEGKGFRKEGSGCVPCPLPSKPLPCEGGVANLRGGRGGRDALGVAPPVQRRHNQVQQLGLLEGLGQVGRQAEFAAMGRVARLARR